METLLSLPQPLPFKEDPRLEEEHLTELYYQKVVKAPEIEKLKYFATIQKQLETNLKRKYDKLGYKMVREQGAPGLYYKIVSKKDIFEFNVIERSLVLNALFNDLCFMGKPQVAITPQQINFTANPDVHMLDFKYRKEKINKVTDVAIKKFISMKKLI